MVRVKARRPASAAAEREPHGVSLAEGQGTPNATKTTLRSQPSCPARAGVSRRLDPLTNMHWKAAGANTAFAAAMLKALAKRKGGAA